MTSVTPSPQSWEYRKRSRGGQLVHTLKLATITAGAAAFVVLAIPLLLIMNAALLLVALWPIFIGGWIEYGFVPGQRVFNAPALGHEWYWLQAAWIVVAVATAIILIKHKPRLTRRALPMFARIRPRRHRRRRPA